MKHPNNLRALRKAAGLTQESIAEVWGVHRGDVSRIERGEHSISTHKRELLTRHFGWTVAQLLEPSAGQTITINGYVRGAGDIEPMDGVPAQASATALNDSQSADATGPSNSLALGVPMPPAEISSDLACLIVDGRQLEPLYRAGDILYYHTSAHGEPAILHRDCIIELPSGKQLLGTLTAGDHAGHYHVSRPGQPELRNTEIRWAAPIAWVKKG